MSDLDELARLGVTLPGVTVTGPGHLDLAGKGLTWTWKERIRPKQPRVERLDVIAFRTIDSDDKLALIETYPDACFTEPHYNGYPAVLVRIEVATTALVAELLVDAWRAKAPRGLAAGFAADAWLAAATAGRNAEGPGGTAEATPPGPRRS